MNCSPFSVLSGPFVRHYSIFNDGILNSVMMHVLDKDFNIVINPCTLTRIPGGFMDHIKLAAQILSIVNSIQTYENVSSFEPAEKAFINQFQSQFSGSFTSSPLAIFSSCKLSSVDFDSKCIHLKFENSLCGIVCWWILFAKKSRRVPCWTLWYDVSGNTFFCSCCQWVNKMYGNLQNNVHWRGCHFCKQDLPCGKSTFWCFENNEDEAN